MKQIIGILLVLTAIGIVWFVVSSTFSLLLKLGLLFIALDLLSTVFWKPLVPLHYEKDKNWPEDY